ncbi:hypothetical protein QVD17_31418 [Tagetes erecta]|uniref:Uncharacterized protein n=1 Tax=Tagetes erecta TaxID=13708 RepID=A0AAD8K4H4_TARER|nr:hypothetical protein QVD17_31418 [Tagetes erecta]
MEGKGKNGEKKEKSMIPPPRKGQIKDKIIKEWGDKILNLTSLGGGGNNVREDQLEWNDYGDKLKVLTYKMEGKGKNEVKKEKAMIPPKRGQIKEKIFQELGEKIFNIKIGGGEKVRGNQVSSSSQDYTFVSPTKT